MTRPTWDTTWIQLAILMAKRSRCPTGAGCVIVDSQRSIIQTGYAGPPAEFLTVEEELADTCLAYCQRPWTEGALRDPGYRDCPSVHAELNALMRADLSRVRGGTIYVSSAICGLCVKTVANSGVVRAVWPRLPGLEYRDEAFTTGYLERCQIRVDVIDWNLEKET